MKLVHAALLLSLPLLIPVGAFAAPAKKTTPAVKKPVQVTAAARETTAMAAQSTSVLMKDQLKRLMIGNQAGIVKILGPNRKGVSYARGIDDRSLARLDDEARDSIFGALNFKEQQLPGLAQSLIAGYSKLPKKEAVALLGALGSKPDLEPATRAQIEAHLLRVMETDKDVTARRQAILALALLPEVSSETTERVVKLFEHSENLWETFPVQQYFEYHAAQVRQLQTYAQLRERIGQVRSLYTPNVLSYLDQAQGL